MPDAHDPSKSHAPVMFTSDLALREDPSYAKISKRFHENPDELAVSFAKAWFKLTHRDMGPYVRGLGPLVPEKPELWQDPVPEVDHELVGDKDIEILKEKLLNSGLSVTQLVETAWASASTFRGTDKRGGANGGRIRLSPQKDWEVNNPSLLKTVIGKLESIQTDFNNAQTSDKKISFADLVVLGGCAGIEKAAQIGGHNLSVPFTPGRTDATQEMTDADSFAVLEPTADGFRNFVSKNHFRDAADSLIDRSHMLTLSGPEMTALLGGLRVLNVNTTKNKNGVLTNKSDTLSNDFFTNLLDLSTEWKLSDESTKTYEGIDRVTGNVKWVGSSVDLTFGSNSQLRAVAEVYASDDSESMFINDFVAAWTKVMNLDRFDI